MKLLIAGLAAMLAMALGPTIAVGSGINLSWDDCGTHGTGFKSFSCDTNTGAHTIVGSFLPNFVVESMTSSQMILDLNSEAPSLPDWWRLGSGACRAGSLNADFDFTSGYSSCFDYWQGGAIGAATHDVPIGNRTRITVNAALLSGPPGPIAADTEVYSFSLKINHARTTGDGACAGCDGGVCILFTSIRLMQQAPAPPSIILTNPIDRAFVEWQCPTGITIAGPCYFFGCPTPARGHTWGQIKQLYR
jgi:hypothetical protein